MSECSTLQNAQAHMRSYKGLKALTIHKEQFLLCSLIVVLATTIGLTVPVSYVKNPECGAYILFLASFMLIVWGTGLGATQDLELGNLCMAVSTRILSSSGVHAITVLPGNIFLIISLCGENAIKIWKAADSKHVPLYSEHQSEVSLVDILHSVCCASWSNDGEIHIWKYPCGSHLRKLLGHEGNLISLRFSQNAFEKFGSVLISIGDFGLTCVWNFKNGDVLLSLQAGTHSMRSCATSFVNTHGVGHSIFGFSSGRVHSYNLLSHEETIFNGHFGPVTSLCVHEGSGGTLLLSSSADWTVRSWDLASGEPRLTLEGHSGSVDTLALLTYGCSPMIISGSKDATVRVWSLLTGNLYRTLEGHSSGVRCVAVTRVHSKASIVSGDADATIRIWDLEQVIRDLKWGRRRMLAWVVSVMRARTMKSLTTPNSVLGPSEQTKLFLAMFFNDDVLKSVACFL